MSMIGLWSFWLEFSDFPAENAGVIVKKEEIKKRNYCFCTSVWTISYEANNIIEALSMVDEKMREYGQNPIIHYIFSENSFNSINQI